MRVESSRPSQERRGGCHQSGFHQYWCQSVLFLPISKMSLLAVLITGLDPPPAVFEPARLKGCRPMWVTDASTTLQRS